MALAEGTFTGTVELPEEKEIVTKTFVRELGPMTGPELATYLKDFFTNWEENEYDMLAYQVIDTGSGWIFVYSAGYDAP